MQGHTFPPLVEAFLILDQPRQRLSHWTQALALLDDQRAPPLASVNGYYDPRLDQALLGVSYDELALGADRLAYVVDVALLAEVGMVQPAELTEGDRRRFYGERLARCTVTVSHQRNVVSGLVELVRRIREQRAAQGLRASQELPVTRAAPPPPPPPMAMLARPRAPSDPEILVVQPRSTRDALGLERERLAALARSPGRGGAERPTPPSIPTIARRLTQNVISRAATPSAPPAPASSSGARRMSTVEMDPLTVQQLAATDAPHAPALSEQTRPNARVPAPAVVADGSQGRRLEPYPQGAPLPTGSIYARYLRSGRWVPIRIGTLSLRGAALLTSAPPRVDDRVDIALAFAELRAQVRGPVQKVSTREEAARRGAASFHVAFDLDEEARRRLTALLQAARAANITIKPPPPRGNRRYPVEWPVCLGTARGAIRAEALDVSREGMFVRQANALAPGASLSFSVVLDDSGGPVTGSSRVVRVMDEPSARSCGMAPGYGLHIVDMADADRDRWSGFLARVERRAERRVLIGAGAGRLRELQGGLAAAGYAVAGATDPAALVALASKEERAVDACLIDAAWAQPSRTSTWSERLFPTRNVPCVAMRGDVRRAREAIDQVLSIV